MEMLNICFQHRVSLTSNYRIMVTRIFAYKGIPLTRSGIRVWVPDSADGQAAPERIEAAREPGTRRSVESFSKPCRKNAR